MRSTATLDVLTGHLVKTSKAALEAGIAACGPGRPYKDIGQAIHKLLLKQPNEYHICPMFTGHGIGTVFHKRPWIIHEREW
jgi:methionyl aminopeptidase